MLSHPPTFFYIYSHGLHIATGLQGMHLLAGQSCSQGRARHLQRLELQQEVLLLARGGLAIQGTGCCSAGLLELGPVLQTKNTLRCSREVWK